MTPATQPYRWAMLGGASLVYFCFGLTVAAMAPLVNPVASELGLSHSAMGSVLGAWQLVYCWTASARARRWSLPRSSSEHRACCEVFRPVT